MIMPGAIPYRCHEHGLQISRGCVVECPVCKHREFLQRYYPENLDDFNQNWQTSQYNDPASEEDMWFE